MYLSKLVLEEVSQDNSGSLCGGLCCVWLQERRDLCVDPPPSLAWGINKGPKKLQCFDYVLLDSELKSQDHIAYLDYWYFYYYFYFCSSIYIKGVRMPDSLQKRLVCPFYRMGKWGGLLLPQAGWSPRQPA